MNLLLQGSLEVICGPMFSGKTEELIRRVRRAQIARQKIQVFKPALDNRYDKEKVVSHSSLSIDSIPVNNPLEILTKLFDSTRVIAIDEVQFFDAQIVKVILKLIRRGHRVIVAGLDLDYLGKPFGSMPELLALADEVAKVSAVCTVCGGKATKTQRLYLEDGIMSSQEQILIGHTDKYEARCPSHFEIPLEESQQNELLPFMEEFIASSNN